MLSEPLPPCPSCGGGARPGYRLGHNPGDYPYCGECHFSVAPDAWRRLADAVALAAALTTVLERSGELILSYEDGAWHADTGSVLAGGDTWAEAIIKLTLAE
jgi:hypothetical protein